MSFEHILYQKKAGVGHVTLNRPDKLNTLGIGPGSSRDEIGRALAEADGDPEVGCLLITANGRSFCAGGDLSGAPPTETPLDEHLFVEAVDRFHAGIRALHKPVVAAVHGLCLGSGLSFMAQCDLVIAAEDARFGLIEGRIGHPGATEIVPLVGSAWAKFMILTGELIDARWAQEIGLILVALPPDTLLERAWELAERIARLPRDAVLLNKAAIDRMMEATGRDAGRLVGRAHDALTKSMSRRARAPDGRLFEAILAAEGMEGLKRARNLQYSEPWLPRRDPGDTPKG